MLKNIFALMAMLLIVAPASAMALEGGVGYQRSSLAQNGSEIYVFKNATPGLLFDLPMNESEEGANDETWGLDFGMNYLGDVDESASVTTMAVRGYRHFGPLKGCFGLTHSWLEDGANAEDAIDPTKFFGLTAALQATRLGQTFELSGGWGKSWEGLDDAAVRSVNFSLIL